MSLQPSKKKAPSSATAGSSGSSSSGGSVRTRRSAAAADAEPTAEEVAAAARAAAQAMASDPTLRRGYAPDPTGALDASSGINASRTNALRTAQQQLQQRVAGLHDKVAREERQHRAEAGLAAKGRGGGSKARPSDPSGAGMIDFGLDEFDDDDAGLGLGSAAATGADDMVDDLDAEMAAEDAAFEAEERDYARMLAKESKRRAASKAALEAHRASLAAERGVRLAEMDSEEWLLRHTREKSLDDVRTLSLANQRLHALPAILAALPSLRSLDLSANVLRAMTTAAASGGSHSDAVVRPLARLSDLRELKAQHNELEALDSFRGSPHLQTLRLDYNNIAAIPSGAVRDCSKLQLLSLRANRIVEVPPASFPSSLTSLDLSANQLVSLSFLPALLQLREGFFSHNRIRGALPCLAKLLFLDELHVDHNEIESIEGVGTMPALTVLNLSYNRIKKITGAVVMPPPTPAAASASSSSSSAPPATPAPRREAKGLVSSAAAAARESAAIDAATIAAAALKASPVSTTAAAAAAASQKSFPLFPVLSDLLLSHNLVSEVRAEFSLIYPRVETLDLSFNRIESAPLLLQRVAAVKDTLLEFKLKGNPCAPASEEEGASTTPNGTAARPSTSSSSLQPSAAATTAPLSPRSYRSAFLHALPLLENLDGADVDRSEVDEGGNGGQRQQQQQAHAQSRPATSAGNVTPRPHSSAGMASLSSRPSTASLSRPGTAAGTGVGAMARPGSARRSGNPLMMRPPSAAAVRGSDHLVGVADSLGAGSPTPDADSSELASSAASLSTLSTRMEGQVRETSAQLASFKDRFEKLLAHSVAAIKRRGMDSKITERSARGEAPAAAVVSDAAEEPTTAATAASTPSHSARDNTFMTATAASARAKGGAVDDARQQQQPPQSHVHSPDRSPSRSSASIPHSSPHSARGPVSALHFTPSKLDSRPASSSGGAGRPISASGGERRGATTPRQRLEQAKLFSHSVYGMQTNGSSATSAAGGEAMDPSRFDELTGELLPAALSKSRATSAPYKPQHSKPSFAAPGQPLPSLTQPPPSPSPTDATAAAATAAPASDSQPSKPSTPSRISTGASRVKKSSVSTGSAASTARPVSSSSSSAGGLFDSPFTEMKAVPSRAATVTAAAKAAIAASKVAAAAGGGSGVTPVAAAGAAGGMGAGLKSSPSNKSLPSTRAVPISTGVVSTRMHAQAPVSMSTNRPVVPGGALAPTASAAMAGLGISGRSVGSAAASDAPAAPAPLTIRQQLIAAKLAQAAASPPEELSLDGDDDDEEDGEGAGLGGAGTLEDLAQHAAASEDEAESDESDPTATLFARPWSAHARAAHSALNSARSRPQSAARARGPAEVAMELEGDAPYAAFHVPRRADPSAALQQQLRNQINVSNAYAHAFAQRPAAAAAAPAAAAGVAGGPYRAGGQTPRGPHNPFLLHNPLVGSQ